MSLRHWIAHLFGWNTGEVYVWYDHRKKLMVGFMCHECKSISGVHESITNYQTAMPQSNGRHAGE